jgi:PII-like signaling protein
MHSAKLLRLSEDLPVVIEIVDTQENVERLMPYLEENLEEAVVTKENVDIVKYSKNE